jgi:hypothetical protein
MAGLSAINPHTGLSESLLGTGLGSALQGANRRSGGDEVGPAEEMYERVNAGWMDLGIVGTEHVAGTTSARDVFAGAQQAVKAKGHSV